MESSCDNQSDIVPSQADFVDVFSDRLDADTDLSERQSIATELYNVLFGLTLSRFDKKQFLLLSTLMHSDDSLQSADIFKEIAILFPQISTHIENIYKHKHIIPNISQTSENNLSQQDMFSSDLYNLSQQKLDIYKNIPTTLFDVFSLPQNYDLFQDAVRKGYIKYVQDTTKDDAQYLLDNVSMLQYNPLLGEMTLQLNSPKEFESFEKKYMPSLKIFLRKCLGYSFKKLEYKVLEHTLLTPVHKDKTKITAEKQAVINTIKEQLIPRYTWNSYQGNQKEKVKNLLGKEQDNIFIGGNDNLGKTHLIQAVIKKLESEGSPKKIVYTTGNKMYKEIQYRFGEDRKELNVAKKNNIAHFLSAFDSIDVLVIDNVDHISSGSKSTQDIINRLYTLYNVQLVLLSNVPPADIHWHQKDSFREGGGTMVPIDLANKFSPVLVEMNAVDYQLKKKIAKDIWDKNILPNLFLTPELVSGIIDFMADYISPKIYPQIITSIKMMESDKKNISQKIYDLIEKITGKIILPKKNEIIDILIEEFNLDTIQQYVNVLKINKGITPNIQKADLSKDYILSDSLDGTLLRLCIYFIKKYYPKESLETIGEQFNRSNTSPLYHEAKDWLKNEKQLESFLDGQIKKNLKKKYGLQHDI